MLNCYEPEIIEVDFIISMHSTWFENTNSLILDWALKSVC